MSDLSDYKYYMFEPAIESCEATIADLRTKADNALRDVAALTARLQRAEKALFQSRVGDWMIACFGSDITNSLDERCFRFFEEAGELCQALDMTEEMAHQLVAYTWGREKGLPSQEVGGVLVTLAALCFAAKLDMAEDGETELTRISAPEVMDKIRRKHAAKVLRTPHSALPGDLRQATAIIGGK